MSAISHISTIVMRVYTGFLLFYLKIRWVLCLKKSIGILVGFVGILVGFIGNCAK